uniref:Uncharacterized protein n=1 Tax=Triticum urartu TaxID=4572 RepID=A0A8R7JUN7_TRIUA
TAYDVSLNDDSWPQEAFELVSGSTSKIVEKLDPGSTTSHNFVLETKAQGKFQGSPTIINYRVPPKAALQICWGYMLYLVIALCFTAEPEWHVKRTGLTFENINWNCDCFMLT